MRMAGVTLGRELRAPALSHTAPVHVAPPDNSVTKSRADSTLTQQVVGYIEAINS